MARRFVSIWFPHLATDWFSLSQPQLHDVPFVLRAPSHGRMMITAANAVAQVKGIDRGMVLADARAVEPRLHVLDDIPGLPEKLLRRLAEWCIRFTPYVGIDLPDGLLLDVTGCSHLWGGDEPYIEDIIKRLRARHYNVRAAMADTIGAAWAVARYGKSAAVIESGRHYEAILSLPPEALRLGQEVVERLHKLGLHRISQFITISRLSLLRRFGPEFQRRLDQALGKSEELIQPVQPVEPYQERLPCPEPIVTATGIEIALEELLKMLCLRLSQEQKGLRTATFKGYRVDNKIEQIRIETNRPSHHVKHLFKLFSLKTASIEPAAGIELFVLEANKVEDHIPGQEKLWDGGGGLHDVRIAELIDRMGGKIGLKSIQRYLPAEHYWPERSVKLASSLHEEAMTTWRTDRPRPLQLLPVPQRIEVTAPIPDYPPMLFVYKGRIHKITKADGPERIEQEWWLQQGQHRDYYRVEDEEGKRYWIFRSGFYDDDKSAWFVHGFFA